MTNCCWRFTFILFTGLFTISQTSGQKAPPDSAASFKKSVVYFQNEIAEDAHLYTGKEYFSHPLGIKGHAFFMSPEMQNSDIFYDGTLYTDIPLLFDIVNQEIVINRYNQEVRIKLLNEKVRYFTLSGHRFENVPLTTGKSEDISTAIYDVMFDGKAKLFVKRRKRIKSALRAEDPPSYVQEDEYYIQNGNTLYAVDGKGPLLQALNDQKDLIKAFARKNKFRFKKKIEKELVMATAYYSTLNK